MSRRLRITIFLIVAVLFSVVFSAITFAQDCDSIICNQDDSGEKSSCISKKINCWSDKISEAQSTTATLKSVINVLNGQIKVLQLQIDQSLSEISALEKEISELSDRIVGLDFSLDNLTSVLVQRVSEQYKRRYTNPIDLIFAQTGFTTKISGLKYLKLARQQTSDAMARAEALRLDYDEQKTLKEQKQQELEAKRLKLERQKGDLAAKRSEQDVLLKNTQNNEKVYQAQLQDAQKELQQIADAAKVVIREGNEVIVKKGEVIGTMGNTGYSFGDHLHFGVYRYSISTFNTAGSWYGKNYINPLDKLKSTTVFWDTGCGGDPSGSTNSGSGSWDWPLANVRITQGYGHTCYSDSYYRGKDHPALDMVAQGNISVRAVEDGEAYFCRNCLGDGGNGVYVFHEGDYMTLYWHLK